LSREAKCGNGRALWTGVVLTVAAACGAGERREVEQPGSAEGPSMGEMGEMGSKGTMESHGMMREMRATRSE
jgi:hypothetical protein